MNEDPKDALLRQFQIEIEQLRQQLQENCPEISESEGESEEIQHVMNLRETKSPKILIDTSEFSHGEKEDKPEKYLETLNDMDIIELKRTQ